MNAQSIPLCLDFVGTLTPANPRYERTLEVIRPAAIDPSTLPFRTDLLQWLREQRANGRRMILLADGEAELAEQVAAHLGLFDAVAHTEGHGTAAERKRRALVEHFGERGFDYAGSNEADMIVWEASRAPSSWAIAVSGSVSAAIPDCWACSR